MIPLDKRIERFMKKRYPKVYCPVCNTELTDIETVKLYACSFCSQDWDAVPMELKYANFIKLRYEEFTEKFGEEDIDWYIEEFG